MGRDISEDGFSLTCDSFVFSQAAHSFLGPLEHLSSEAVDITILLEIKVGHGSSAHSSEVTWNPEPLILEKEMHTKNA